MSDVPIISNVSRGEDAAERGELMKHDLRDGGVLDESAHVDGFDRALPHRRRGRSPSGSQGVALLLTSPPACDEDQHRYGGDTNAYAESDDSGADVAHGRLGARYGEAVEGPC